MTNPNPLAEMIKAAVVEALGEIVKTTDIRPQRLVNAEDAALYLGMSRANVYVLMNRGEIPCVKSGRMRLIDKDDLDRWIKDHKQHGEQNQRVA